MGKSYDIHMNCENGLFFRDIAASGHYIKPMTTIRDILAGGWRRPEILLFLMAGAVPLSFAAWSALLNNFAIERAAFDGADMGILQSLREVPGFLAFAVVFVLIFMREQTLVLVALLLLGIGTAITGFFPTVMGLYFTTVLMSLGYHYYATMETSLALQWIETKRLPETMGRMIAVGSFTSIIAFGLVWLAFDYVGLDFKWVYMLGGGLTVAAAGFAWFAFPRFQQQAEQHHRLVLRSRYWLFYALAFMSGARRQIFVVFAGFLMVEKFGYDVGEISLLLLINAAINVWLAPKIGRLIGRWGERRALIFEYTGLVGVFTLYAFIDNGLAAAGLYIVDHLFFSLAIAQTTYFQKIADSGDIAATAGVSFSIDHTAAVVIPAAFGFLWLISPATVFLAGAAMAGVTLVLALNVPHHPEPGNEVVFGLRRRRVVPAE